MSEMLSTEEIPYYDNKLYYREFSNKSDYSSEEGQIMTGLII